MNTLYLEGSHRYVSVHISQSKAAANHVVIFHKSIMLTSFYSLAVIPLHTSFTEGYNMDVEILRLNC